MVNKKWAIAVAIVVAAAMVGAVLSASDWTASANPASSSNSSDNMNKGSTSQDSVHSAGNVSAGAMAEYANNAVTDYCQPSAYDVALASSINATVSYQYTPGTYYYAGGIFMQNDTWYSMIVNEKVVGTACSGQVWDIVCLGNGNVSALTMETQNANGDVERRNAYCHPRLQLLRDRFMEHFGCRSHHTPQVHVHREPDRVPRRPDNAHIRWRYGRVSAVVACQLCGRAL